ncbi:MAG: hypothetical protein L0Y54_15340 [Sporichthyaceae bacterium]|nr:hypothetical protein [Sporichthyaceae bacterium]
MQSPKRVIRYGLGVWLGLVAISLILLPAEGKNEALYESIKLSVLVAVTLGFAIRYLGQHPDSGLREGVLVGFTWAAVSIALDLALFVAGAFNIGLAEYFSDVASSYAVMPIVAAALLGYLRRR